MAKINKIVIKKAGKINTCFFCETKAILLVFHTKVLHTIMCISVENPLFFVEKCG